MEFHASRIALKLQEKIMNNDKKDGYGTCPICNEYVGNVSLHTQFCGKPKEECAYCKGTGKVRVIENAKDAFKLLDGIDCPMCTKPPPEPPNKRKLNEDVGLANWLINLYRKIWGL